MTKHNHFCERAIEHGVGVCQTETCDTCPLKLPDFPATPLPTPLIIERHYALTIRADNGQNILSISTNGEISFGSAAYPEEAVKKFHELWLLIVGNNVKL